tara:strand:- start:1029 stop:1493 length:465 start_codon:yes stop_codon:yes gene_type:complete
MRQNNGGAVIAARALLTSLILFLFAIAFDCLFNPEESVKITWLFIVFGAAYAAFYSRFVSQWSYLANLYNQIKGVECNKESNELILAQWKAGFLEDADFLHLSCKKNFASIINEWGKNPEVKAAYVAHSPGGQEGFDDLMKKVKKVLEVKRSTH